MSVVHVTGGDQFKTEVVEFDWIVIIDFWAERCGPCRMLWPIMEELSTDNEGKAIKFVKVNVDENPELSGAFQVSSIPVVFFMKDGKPVDAIVGANPKEVYQNKIDALATAAPTAE